MENDARDRGLLCALSTKERTGALSVKDTWMPAGDVSGIDQRQTQRLDDLAEWIESKGLRTPAILFLEASKPLAPVGSQLLLLVQPLLGFVLPWWHQVDDRVLAEYAAVLEDPDVLERLLIRLERPGPAQTE